MKLYLTRDSQLRWWEISVNLGSIVVLAGGWGASQSWEEVSEERLSPSPGSFPLIDGLEVGCGEAWENWSYSAVRRSEMLSGLRGSVWSDWGQCSIPTWWHRDTASRQWSDSASGSEGIYSVIEERTMEKVKLSCLGKLTRSGVKTGPTLTNSNSHSHGNKITMIPEQIDSRFCMGGRNLTVK